MFVFSARNGVIMPRSRSDCHITAYRWYGKGRLFLLSASRTGILAALWGVITLAPP